MQENKTMWKYQYEGIGMYTQLPVHFLRKSESIKQSMMGFAVGVAGGDLIQ